MRCFSIGEAEALMNVNLFDSAAWFGSAVTGVKCIEYSILANAITLMAYASFVAMKTDHT